MTQRINWRSSLCLLQLCRTSHLPVTVARILKRVQRGFLRPCEGPKVTRCCPPPPGLRPLTAAVPHMWLPRARVNICELQTQAGVHNGVRYRHAVFYICGLIAPETKSSVFEGKGRSTGKLVARNESCFITCFMFLLETLRRRRLRLYPVCHVPCGGKAFSSCASRDPQSIMGRCGCQ